MLTLLRLAARRLPYRVEWWRDPNSEERRIGFEVSASGGAVGLGLRLYRWRWVRRG
jgi:hypothetical protein